MLKTPKTITILEKMLAVAENKPHRVQEKPFQHRYFDLCRILAQEGFICEYGQYINKILKNRFVYDVQTKELKPARPFTCQDYHE